MYILKHSAKGTTWSEHKYISKQGKRYIYANPETNTLKVLDPTEDISVDNYTNEVEKYNALYERRNNIYQKLQEIGNKENKTAEDRRLYDSLEKALSDTDKEMKEQAKKVGSARTGYDEKGNKIGDMAYYGDITDKDLKNMQNDIREMKITSIDQKRNNYMPASDKENIKLLNDKKAKSKMPTSEKVSNDTVSYKTSNALKERQKMYDYEQIQKRVHENYSKDLAKKKKKEKDKKFIKGIGEAWWEDRTSKLKHHGILGQKWGKRNGPPYPLDAEDHSAAEKKANRQQFDKGGDTKDKYEPNKNKSPEINKHKSRPYDKKIEDKVKKARETNQYDMDFLEKGLDVDERTGNLLEGKALDNAYRKYLQNKANKERAIQEGDIRSGYKHRRELTQNELENILKRYNTELKYKEAIKKMDEKKRKDIINFITGRSEDLETVGRALKAVSSVLDGFESLTGMKSNEGNKKKKK